MILRRVISHVRNQEWTAIGLDFLIVVLGVFIGIQLGNWNAMRQDRDRAEVYTERLMDELRVEFEYASALINYNKTLRSVGGVAYQGLAEKEALEDEVILINAFRATQYNWYERRRAVFDEIVFSGALALVSDVALREAAIGMYNTPIFSLVLEEGQDSRYRELFRMAVEPALHDELWSNCGDKEYESDGAAVGLFTLDYDCAIEASNEEMAEGVRALRSDPEILRALKLRIAQVTGRVSDYESTLSFFGMNALFAEEAAP